MEGSPFAKLPAELRNTIYTYALVASRPLEFTYSREFLIAAQPPPRQWKWKANNRNLTTSRSPIAEALALTFVCKQIRQETNGMFFTLNEIELYVDGGYEVLNGGFLRRFAYFLAPRISPTQTTISQVKISLKDCVVSGVSTSLSSSYFTRLVGNLRKQGAELGWNVCVSMRMRFSNPDDLGETAEFILPINGTTAEMIEAIDSLGETVADGGHREGVHFMRQKLTLCIWNAKELD